MRLNEGRLAKQFRRNVRASLAPPAHSGHRALPRQRLVADDREPLGSGHQRWRIGRWPSSTACDRRARHSWGIEREDL